MCLNFQERLNKFSPSNITILPSTNTGKQVYWGGLGEPISSWSWIYLKGEMFHLHFPPTAQAFQLILRRSSMAIHYFVIGIHVYDFQKIPQDSQPKNSKNIQSRIFVEWWKLGLSAPMLAQQCLPISGLQISTACQGTWGHNPLCQEGHDPATHSRGWNHRCRGLILSELGR